MSPFAPNSKAQDVAGILIALVGLAVFLLNLWANGWKHVDAVVGGGAALLFGSGLAMVSPDTFGLITKAARSFMPGARASVAVPSVRDDPPAVP